MEVYGLMHQEYVKNAVNMNQNSMNISNCCDGDITLVYNKDNTAYPVILTRQQHELLQKLVHKIICNDNNLLIEKSLNVKYEQRTTK